MDRQISRLRNGLQIDGRPTKVDTTEVTVVIAGAKGVVLAYGATVPTDEEAGYAKGCLFIDTTGGAGDTIYVNEGDEVKCDFNIGSLSSGDITAVTAGEGLDGGGAKGAVTVSLSAETLALLAIVDDIPTADAEDSATIWNDNGVLKVSSSKVEDGETEAGN